MRGDSMKKLSLLAFLYTGFLMGMANISSGKVYLRVVVTEPKRAELARLVVLVCDDMQKFCTEKFIAESSVLREKAEKWAHEIICQYTGDSQGFMRGFVGKKNYIDDCVETFKKGLGLQVMYHYKESSCERIGLTDVPSFLGCSAYLQACEQQAEKFMQKSSSAFERKILSSGFQERKNCDNQPECDEPLYDADDETVFISPLSDTIIGGETGFKRSPPLSNLLQVSDSELSCSVSQGSRYSSEESMSCGSALVFQPELREKALQQGVSVIIQTKTQTPKARSVSSRLRVETPRDPLLDKEEIVLNK